MIKIKIGEQSYDMPETMDEISFEKYIEYNKSMTKEESIFNQKLRILSFFTGIEFETLQQVRIDDLKNLFDNYSLDFLFEKNKEYTKTEWVINGETYKLINDFSNITGLEYHDATQFISNLDNYHKLIALCLRKEGEEYDAKKIEIKAQMMKDNLTGKDVKYICDFFLSGTSNLLKILETYSTLLIPMVK